MSRALEDKDAIREAMARYCHAIDACRFADVAALFLPDGEWTTDYGAARGRAAIEALLINTVPVKGEGPQRKHYITNVVIELDGDVARSVSDYFIIRESERGLIPVMGGTYRDTFRRHDDGKWYFARKELVHDIVGDMALKNKR
jgi:ketosteroid isomerase-like protein